MKCVDVMKTALAVASPDDSIGAAAKKMAERGVGFLPVVDGEKAIGVLTDRDIVVRVVAADAEAPMVVRDAMTKDIVSVARDDDLDKAGRVMGEKQVSRVLVVEDNGDLAGVISLSDLPQFDDVRARETLAQVTTREVQP
jgi:CBS domain-containing protein